MEVIANKILRNEYYKGVYQLDEEVLFLQYKIRKAFLESKGIDSKEYFDIKYDCCKISQIDGISFKRMNVTLLFLA